MSLLHLTGIGLGLPNPTNAVFHLPSVPVNFHMTGSSGIDVPSFMANMPEVPAAQIIDAHAPPPGFSASQWANVVDDVPSDCWSAITKFVVDDFNIRQLDNVKSVLYDVGGALKVGAVDYMIPGTRSMIDFASPGLTYAARGAVKGSQIGARTLVNLGEAAEKVGGIAAGMTISATNMLAHGGYSFAGKAILEGVSLMGEAWRSISLTNAVGHLLSIPIYTLIGLYFTRKLVFRKLVSYCLRSGTMSRAATEALSVAIQHYLQADGTLAGALSRAAIKYAAVAGRDIAAASGRGLARGVQSAISSASGVASRGANQLVVAGGHVAENIGQGFLRLEEAGEQIGVIGGRAAAVTQRALNAVVDPAVDAAVDLVLDGPGAIGSGISRAGSAIARGARGAGAAASRAGAAVGRAMDSTAFKVGAGVLTIGSEVLNMYNFYCQANDLHMEVADLDEMKRIIGDQIDPSHQFQIDEFIRQREASINQHRINLGVSAGLTAASGAISFTMLATGASLMGPLGWLGLGIGLLAFGAVMYEDKIDRDRIKEDNDNWLKTWYGSATQPSLRDYLLKRDPTGALLGWMKSIKDMPFDESESFGVNKFDSYLTQLKRKITNISGSYEAGLFDNRYEELLYLSRTNPVEGVNILKSRWEGQPFERGTSGQFLFEEASLLSTSIALDVSAGRTPEQNPEVTQEDLDYFFRGVPYPEGHDHMDQSWTPEEEAKWEHDQSNATQTASTKVSYEDRWDRHDEAAPIVDATQTASTEDPWDRHDEAAPIVDATQQTLETSSDQAESIEAVSNVNNVSNINMEDLNKYPNNISSSQPQQNKTNDAKEPDGPIWRYPDSKRSFNQEGLLYDERLSFKRRHI